MDRGLQPGFGVRLRHLRLTVGLKQTDMAALGLSQSYISHLEAGRREPSPDTVRRLADHLRVTEQALTGRQNEVASGLLLLGRADMLSARGEHDAAQALYRGALDDAGVMSSPDWTRPVQGLAGSMERDGDLDGAVRLLEGALPRAAADAAATVEGGTVSLTAYARLCTALARCYRESGDLSRAVDVATAAVEALSDQRPLPAGYAQLVATLASAHADRGDLLRASQLLENLLAVTEVAEDAAAQAAAHWNAGLVAAERGRTLDALRSMDRAAWLIAEQQDERALARIKISQAWLLLSSPAPDAVRAEALLLRAMPDLERHATRTDVASAHTELARACLALGRPQDAAGYARAAEELLSEQPNLESARAAALLGRALIALGDPETGTDQLDRAARVLSGFGSTREAAGLWRGLADAYTAAGQTDRALQAYAFAMDTLGVQGDTTATDPLLMTRSVVF